MAITGRLRRFHRWHALAMSLVVLGAASSGLLHVLMARQPPPPAPRPAAGLALAAARIAPGELASLLPDGAVPTAASLRPIGNRPYWQVVLAGQQWPIYVDAVDGRLDPQAERRYAAEIACAHLGLDAVTHDRELMAFDREYIALFRTLPVHRFTCADGRGTRVYVSTLTGSVTRHTDDARQTEADLFSLLHKWMFIPNRSWRDGLLTVSMASLCLLALSGMLLFALTRGRRDPRAQPSPGSSPPR